MFIIRKLSSQAEIQDARLRIETETLLSTADQLNRIPEPKLTNMKKEKRGLITTSVDEPKEDDVLFF